MVCFLVSVSSFILRTSNFLPFVLAVHFPWHLRSVSSPLHPVSWLLSPAWSLPSSPCHPCPAICHLPLSTLLLFPCPFAPSTLPPAPFYPFPFVLFPAPPATCLTFLYPLPHTSCPPACIMLMILLNPYNLNSPLLLSCIVW